MAQKVVSIPAPATRRVRAYFASVDRATRVPASFDTANVKGFELDSPPIPWVDLGWIDRFARKSDSKSAQVVTGIPAATAEQVVQSVAAEVSFCFSRWTKLSMALSTGSQHMNVLESPGSAISIQAGSTATSIVMARADAARFSIGDIVAVDVDYSGQVGFVGNPVAAGYLRNPIDDIDYVRRMTFNVGVVYEVNAGGVVLAAPLLGGIPPVDAKIQSVTGFADREGGCFRLEWSGLFVIEGTQGERIFYFYPRLQAKAGTEEMMTPIDKNGEYDRVLLSGRFIALPVTDPLDGERVVCYRSFVPASNALI